jgi:ABC-type multidrug transport system ATPase subunit
MARLEIREFHFHTMGPIDLSVAEGECVGLSGPSGAGKTLFLRAVADLDPHSGSASLNGTEAAAMPGPVWRRKVGLLPAESGWWENEVGGHFSKADEGLLASLGFERDVLRWRIDRLSSGERQRLALARMLSVEPEALLLDEPTANLDPESSARVEALIESYRVEHGAPVIWVGHDPEQLERVSARRFSMEKGYLKPLEGSP